MQEAVSPRFVQLSHGEWRLHFSLRCRHGPHDKGMRFRLRTTRNWSGEAPECDECAEGGVGVIIRFPCKFLPCDLWRTGLRCDNPGEWLGGTDSMLRGLSQADCVVTKPLSGVRSLKFVLQSDICAAESTFRKSIEDAVLRWEPRS